jgi:hypothetical protein
MELIFTDIPEGFFKAKVSEIKEENGAYGPYIRLIFTIIEQGELTNYRFSGIVKPSSLKQSKFYRWITNILGQQPDLKICIQDIIGRECLVYLVKKNNYYSVADVSMNPHQ